MPPPRTHSAPGLLSRGSKPVALIDSFLKSLPSEHSRRSYRRAIEDLYAFADGRPVTPDLVHDWRLELAAKVSTSTVNLRLTAVRSFAGYMLAVGKLSRDEAAGLQGVRGMPFRGTRVGNWLTEQQAVRLLAIPNRATMRGARNYCLLAMLLGCALRVNELHELEVERIVQRDGRWVIADLPGKGGRVRTVAIPAWVKSAIDGWKKISGIKAGRLVRQLTLKPEGLSTYGIRQIVMKAGKKIGVPELGPHDLRRTCARMIRDRGGEIEQIQVMLGHASINTTQRYLGTVQNLRNAVNDLLVF